MGGRARPGVRTRLLRPDAFRRTPTRASLEAVTAESLGGVTGVRPGHATVQDGRAGDAAVRDGHAGETAAAGGRAEGRAGGRAEANAGGTTVRHERPGENRASGGPGDAPADGPGAVTADAPVGDAVEVTADLPGTGAAGGSGGLPADRSGAAGGNPAPPGDGAAVLTAAPVTAAVSAAVSATVSATASATVAASVAEAAAVPSVTVPGPAPVPAAERLPVTAPFGVQVFGLAYRMLGTATEAEQVVHEARLLRQRAGVAGAGPRRLVRLVADLCLDRLAAARTRREEYVGSWLPEPVPYAENRLVPLETAAQRDSVSPAVLVLLERLSPAERLAYLLREVYGHSDADTARVLGIDEADARHLHHLARTEVGAPRRRPADSPEEAARIVGHFRSALIDGDAAGLEELLADDAMAWFDGGGKVGTARRPVIGGTKVARHLAGWAGDFGMADARTRIVPVNGEPAVLVHRAGALVCVIAPELAEGRIIGVRTVANPDKLAFAAARTGADGTADDATAAPRTGGAGTEARDVPDLPDATAATAGPDAGSGDAGDEARGATVPVCGR